MVLEHIALSLLPPCLNAGELPQLVTLVVAEAAPHMRGESSAAQQKRAIMTNGAQVSFYVSSTCLIPFDLISPGTTECVNFPQSSCGVGVGDAHCPCVGVLLGLIATLKNFWIDQICTLLWPLMNISVKWLFIC